MGKKSTNILSHIDKNNNPAMVDVSEKGITKRVARARSVVLLPQEIIDQIKDDDIKSKKGSVFQTAKIAGTMGAKKTDELIPLCHPIGLESCDIEISIKGNKAIIDCTCSVSSKTGVEMEALTGASIAALTIYDMCKALSHEIIISETSLIKKTGGKSDFHRE